MHYLQNKKSLTTHDKYKKILLLKIYSAYRNKIKNNNYLILNFFLIITPLLNLKQQYDMLS